MEIRKTEIFAKILDIVANETELTSEQILSCCRTAETVDARYMLAHLLRREGIYISEIARMMHFSRRGGRKNAISIRRPSCSKRAFIPNNIKTHCEQSAHSLRIISLTTPTNRATFAL